MSFQALVRYEEGGQVHYGDLLETTSEGFKVSKLDGNLEQGFSAAAGAKSVVVKKVCHPYMRQLLT